MQINRLQRASPGAGGQLSIDGPIRTFIFPSKYGEIREGVVDNARTATAGGGSAGPRQVAGHAEYTGLGALRRHRSRGFARPPRGIVQAVARLVDAPQAARPYAGGDRKDAIAETVEDSKRAGGRRTEYHWKDGAQRVWQRC